MSLKVQGQKTKIQSSERRELEEGNCANQWSFTIFNTKKGQKAEPRAKMEGMVIQTMYEILKPISWVVVLNSKSKL